LVRPQRGARSLSSRSRHCVLAGIGAEDRLWEKLTNKIYLDTEAWTSAMRKLVEVKPRSTDHPRAQRAVERPKMHSIVEAVARAAGATRSWIRETRGNSLRGLAAWTGWHEGWLTLRSIADDVLLRSDGHVSDLIRQCDGEFSADATLLGYLDTLLATLRS
jgi:hypothetical protein